MPENRQNVSVSETRPKSKRAVADFRYIPDNLHACVLTLCQRVATSSSQNMSLICSSRRSQRHDYTMYSLFVANMNLTNLRRLFMYLETDAVFCLLGLVCPLFFLLFYFSFFLSSLSFFFFFLCYLFPFSFLFLLEGRGGGGGDLLVFFFSF